MIWCEVDGLPAPQGSKNKGANGQLYEASRNLRPWRDTVIIKVRTAMMQTRHLTYDRRCGVMLTVEFRLTRPPSHHTANGAVKPGKPLLPVYPPDTDKLLRAIGDALQQAGAVHNDSQITTVIVSKRYWHKPGAVILLQADPAQDILEGSHA